jgi:NTE family protein
LARHLNPAIPALIALALALPLWAAQECPPLAPAPHAVPVKSTGKRIGVALGSGSMHGLAHIGVLEELEAHGLDVKVVAGTSVGAVVGSLWASGIPAADIEALARRSDWNFKSGTDLRDALAPHFRSRPIESWPRRFGAVATNLSNGHRRVFMTGDGALAAQASSAVPWFGSPVTIGTEKFGDGALVEPVPVDTARALGAQRVIAVDVAYRPYEEAPSGIAAYAFQAMHILVNSLAERQLRDADFVLRLDVHESFIKCGPESVVARGREAMRNAWPELERLLRDSADR